MKITQKKIAELLHEPACDHNKPEQGKKKKTACQQQAKPGAAQGGCGFDGASIALVPITDAAHLVHGPNGCTGNSWGSRGSLSSGSHLYKMGFTTDLSENDIIMGGEKKLYKAVLEVQKQYQPKAVFVYSTCVPALIGDDIDAVCKAAEKKAGIPVIPVNSPGFVGSKNLGNRLAGETLLEYVIGTAEPAYTTDYDINLIGEYNVAGEMWSVLPLFEKLGIRVLSKISGDARYQEICYAHRAKLNVMICSKALINMARKMEERYGIPYIEESFYGVEDVNNCLRHVAEKLGDADLKRRTEELIAQETAALDVQLAPYRDRLQGKKVVLYTGGVKSWSIISAAKDLGMDVVATSSKKSTEEDKAKIRQLLGKEGVIMEKGNAPLLLQVIKDTKADMLIAGGRNQYTALKARIPFLHINQERHHPYAGYSGMLEMARELDEALYSPVWEQVRRPEPWRDETGKSESSPQNNSLDPFSLITHPTKATVTTSKKAATVNPLKLSQPLGASLAFLGIKGMMPLFHGSQGCTAFAKVVLVRHFCEAIPLATTAMSEVTTILGGEDNIEEAILTQISSSRPDIIGLLTTALTETRGDDVERVLKAFRENHPELDGLPVVYASTPDFKGSLQDGFATAVERLMAEVPKAGEVRPEQVTILAGSAFGPGDVEEIKEIVENFGLTPIVVPDLSTSLDGHLSDDSYNATTSGGTSLVELQEVGSSAFTIALGDSMTGAAQTLQKRFGTNYQVFSHLIGLGAVDEFLVELSRLSEHPVPDKYRRQRRQLQDAMLDNHFFFGRKRVSLALEPDLLYATAWFLKLMGAEIQAAVTTNRSPILEQMPVETVVVGDLGDFEQLAVGSDLLITNSHGVGISQRLGIPLYRQGMPIVDRLGNGQRCSIGYRGSMQVLFEIGNLLLEEEEAQIKEHQLSLVTNQ